MASRAAGTADAALDGSAVVGAGAHAQVRVECHERPVIEDCLHHRERSLDGTLHDYRRVVDASVIVEPCRGLLQALPILDVVHAGAGRPDRGLDEDGKLVDGQQRGAIGGDRKLRLWDRELGEGTRPRLCPGRAGSRRSSAPMWRRSACELPARAA